MADGSAQSDRPLSVREVARGHQVLVASCLDPACGAQAIVGDASAPVFRNASIDRLEEALRCVCGARRGRLTARPFWGPRPPTTGGIYLFVI